MDQHETQLREEIFDRTRQIVELRLAKPGRDDAAAYAGRVYDSREVVAAVEAVLDFWLTLGPQGAKFERELAAILGVRSCVLVNSGSSANLAAIATLTSHKLGQRRLRPGDEVITVAAGFPATVAPIIQQGGVPVLVDVDPATANIRVDQLEDAYCAGKTKAVIVAHTLGNPFDLTAVGQFCKDRNLWLVEDNCDAFGSRYDGKLTGTFCDLSTQSFYPPHHITMGEGGAVNIVRDPLLKTIVESFRDWGRDCWCASGCDNTCNKRFGWTLGELPTGYDHKFIYSHLGYNLKPTDIQAAIGREQLKKLPDFVARRVHNWNYLRRRLARYGELFEFMLPTHARGWSEQGFTWASVRTKVEPSWFGFMIRVRPSAPFSRSELASALDASGVGNRMLFGGNLVRQPMLTILKRQYETGDGQFATAPFRVVGDLKGSDTLMNQAMFVGVYPGLREAQLDHIDATIDQFVELHSRKGALCAA